MFVLFNTMNVHEDIFQKYFFTKFRLYSPSSLFSIVTALLFTHVDPHGHEKAGVLYQSWTQITGGCCGYFWCQSSNLPYRSLILFKTSSSFFLSYISFIRTSMYVVSCGLIFRCVSVENDLILAGKRRCVLLTQCVIE